MTKVAGMTRACAALAPRLLFQEERDFPEIKNRDEHEEADEECRGDVLDYRLRLETQRLATHFFDAKEQE
jgi:hypothetical protein